MYSLKTSLIFLICLLLASCAKDKVEFRVIDEEFENNSISEFLNERYVFSIGYADVNVKGVKEIILPLALSLVREVKVTAEVKLASGSTLPMTFKIDDENINIWVNRELLKIPVHVFDNGEHIFVDRLPLEGEVILRRVEMYFNQQ